MFRRVLRFISSFFNLFINRSSTINNEPVNKVSLVVIILIDIFILANVFTGLADISNWHLSPSEAFPCYQEWSSYKTLEASNKKYESITQAISINNYDRRDFKQAYLNSQTDRLGKVSDICIAHAELKDQVNNPSNKLVIDNINSRGKNITSLKAANQSIRSQYDSTLLEKIANQSRPNSINNVSAERAKQQLEQNNQAISKLEKQTSNLKNELIKKPESINLISFLDDNTKFTTVESGYKNAAFWYPSIQISLQSLFLLPLIAIALLIHNYANRRSFGLVSLISWHLLVIFIIPLLLKIFEFLQIGIIFKFIFDIVKALFGGLLFLIIKFFQKITSNPKGKVVTRVQKYQCIRCAKKIRLNDLHCPYCGFEQFIDCENCQTSTYKSLPYCKQCGHQHSS